MPLRRIAKCLDNCLTKGLWFFILSSLKEVPERFTAVVINFACRSHLFAQTRSRWNEGYRYARADDYNKLSIWKFSVPETL